MTQEPTLTGLEIAVIGMAGRFPRASSVDELWERLLAGTECLSSFTDDQLRSAGVDSDALADPNYVRVGGVVENVDAFDAGFFGYSPREASLLDPQHRFFLEAAWSALEHSGYAPGTFDCAVGVYGGVGRNDYLAKNVRSVMDQVPAEMLHLANDRDFLATRVSYKLNLRGPSLALQTACSTSLVAIHMACQGLIAGECDMALAGGVTIRLPQTAGYLYQEEGISSPDGHCRAFSAEAQGCVPGNGGAVVVLKRLADAHADGDCIHAVIKGSAINNDGSGKVGYTAPGVEGQIRVIRSALGVAGVSADSIGYLEAHGTGTELGDPIEIQAATEAYRCDTQRTEYCAVGSIKTNLGHLDAGAGVTGFIKAVLAVKHGVLPPTLHCEATNPKIDFAHSPFFVNTTRREWPTTGIRRAGVSAFGIGGTNAHVIVEQPPRRVDPPGRQERELVIVSAKNDRALDQASANLANFLRTHPDVPLSDVAFTLKNGRATMPHRRAFLASSAEEAARRLSKTVESERALLPSAPAARLVYMFPGQGSQYASMGKALYEIESVFREHIDAACDVVKPLLGTDLRPLITGPANEEADRQLRDTTLAQPAIFVVSYALAQLAATSRLRPSAMIGHSIGEYVAACLAGVFSLEDALRIVCERGRLMASVPPGVMMALGLEPDEVRRILPDSLSLAAINAPNVSVVAGPADVAQGFMAELETRGIDVRLLHTSHAFHSAAMDPVLDAFSRSLQQIRLREPRVPYISNVTGTWMTSKDAIDPAYWAKHLRGTVRFSEGLQAVLEQPGVILLELGPGQTLTTLARRHTRQGRPPVVALPTTRRPEQSDADQVWLESLAALWTSGVDIDWRRVHSLSAGQRQALPTYPFQRETCWIEPDAMRPLAGKRSDPATWFSVPTWERLPDRTSPNFQDAMREPRGSSLWVVFADGSGLGQAVASRLIERGDVVVTVKLGATYARITETVYQVSAATADHYRQLCAALRAFERDSLRVVHCWSVTHESSTLRGRAHLKQYEDFGFYSVLFLSQALGEQHWLNSCHITVVSSNVFDVVGTEVLCPEKATVAGPIKVVPLEYNSITCAHVDVTLPVSEGDDWRALLDHLCTALDRPMTSDLAIRGRHRWRSTLMPVQLSPVEPAAVLKKRGVYLITGGLGGVGLTIAEHLATTVQARLVLVGREPAPPRAEWDSRIDRARVDAVAALDELTRKEADIRPDVALSLMSSMPGLEQTLDRLCMAYALAFIERSGIDVHKPHVMDRRSLEEACRILPGFERLFGCVLRALEAGRVVTLDGSTVRFTGLRPSYDIDGMRQQAIASFPQLTALFDLLDQSAGQFHFALTGQVPALGLLFGEGNIDTFKRAVAAIRAHSAVPLCEALVRALVGELARRRGQRGPLRILEVGGGDGLLTDALLPELDGRPVEYTFTDISRSFVASAERRARDRGHRFMRFGVLDISSNPLDQGYDAGAFDVIVAFNVVHATERVTPTLANLHRLLAPGGVIVLQESVRSARWVDFIWGLTDGWWAFQDEPLRIESPLLGFDAWGRALRDAGFETVRAFPSHAADSIDTGLIVAIKPVTVEDASVGRRSDDRSLAMTHRRSTLSRLEHLGSEVETIAADVADPVSMKGAIDAALRRFGEINGVIHAALVLNDGAIQAKTTEAVERVFRPKVDGTLVLKELCEGLGLDLFVMCSSLVSILGGRGQVDYCAASNFQDAFARAEQGRLAKSVVSINWGAWREVGKAFRSAVERGASTDDALPHGMSPAEGVDALMRVLASSLPQVLVSPEDLAVLSAERDRLTASESHPHSLNARAADGPTTEAGNADPTRLAPRTETERVIAEIWQEVLGIPQLGIEDNFFDLGGDSMISLQFIAKARKAGLRFTNRQVFEHQTIAELAAVAADQG
ncbi:MAG TPA: beta-ketoacyl synthase N-terminal-like domain-containing protein [Vicinamibacterales bacterium]